MKMITRGGVSDFSGTGQQTQSNINSIIQLILASSI